MPAITFKEINDLGFAKKFHYVIHKDVKIHDSVRIEPFILIEDNVEIGENTIIAPFTQIRQNCKIGSNCKIGAGSVFEGNVKMGNKVRVGTNCNFGWGTVVGNNVFIGNNWIGANDKLMVWGSDKEKDFVPVSYIIEDNVRIGLNSSCLGGITIGHDSIIGMGSFLVKDVPPFSKTYGNPAKITRIK